jgi:hypothetical protein
MAENKEGLQALFTWSYMDTLNESLATNKLCPKLSNSDENCKLHKGLSIFFFSELHEEMEEQYQSFLFYSFSCWLSSGNIVARIYNLQEAVTLFLEEENLKIFTMNLLFLCHHTWYFWEFQYNEQKYTITNITVVTDKVKGMYWEVGLVGRKSRKFGNVFSFERFCGGKQCGNK